jgi:hypothetical protein
MLIAMPDATFNATSFVDVDTAATKEAIAINVRQLSCEGRNL